MNPLSFKPQSLVSAGSDTEPRLRDDKNEIAPLGVHATRNFKVLQVVVFVELARSIQIEIKDVICM